MLEYVSFVKDRLGLGFFEAPFDGLDFGVVRTPVLVAGRLFLSASLENEIESRLDSRRPRVVF